MTPRLQLQHITKRFGATQALANVALQPEYSNGCVLVQQSWISGWSFVLAEITWTIVRGEQQAKRVAINLSRQLHSVIRIDDSSRVNGGDLCSENVDAFKKERSLLGEEYWKTLIRLYDQLVRLNLCEIGIDGKVERDPGRETVFSSQARVKLDRLIDESSTLRDLRDCYRSLAFAGFGKREAGDQLQRSLR